MQYRILHSFLIILGFALSGCYQDVTEVNDENGGSNGNGNGATPPAEFSHTDEPGESNEAFVTGSEFDELIVEIQFMEGMEPAPETLDYLEEFLEEHLEKSDISILDPEQISSSNQASYSREDLREIEEEYRTEYSVETSLVAYLLFVDGDFLDDDGFRNITTLGTSLYNTSAAFFGETIEQISGPNTFEPDQWFVESLTISHQFGHLMGLVNNQTEMVDDHHDGQNEFHCANELCLMHFSTNSSQIFDRQPPQELPEFDEFCLNDLDALRESVEQ